MWKQVKRLLRLQGVPGKKSVCTVCTTAVLQIFWEKKKKKYAAAHKHRESGSWLIARGLGRMHSIPGKEMLSATSYPAHLTFWATQWGLARLCSHLKALAFLCWTRIEASHPPNCTNWQCSSSSLPVSASEPTWEKHRAQASALSGCRELQSCGQTHSSNTPSFFRCDVARCRF